MGRKTPRKGKSRPHDLARARASVSKSLPYGEAVPFRSATVKQPSHAGTFIYHNEIYRGTVTEIDLYIAAE